MSVDVSGISKPKLLVALFNASQQQGMGVLDHRGATSMTEEQAVEILKKGTRFDYLYGRIMKIDIGNDELHEGLYDRDNGEGTVAAVVEFLRKEI